LKPLKKVSSKDTVFLKPLETLRKVSSKFGDLK